MKIAGLLTVLSFHWSRWELHAIVALVHLAGNVRVSLDLPPINQCLVLILALVINLTENHAFLVGSEELR
ncbi:hypothetical protein Y032_0306g1971 [Ancylostoma ceylanicum]|uniref:Uncharacterized protein n=1 Tax=Ancylostoma ceylanicum TaxID=53326 RepID=A0A016S2T1_9BILA|nr:hypothetical protein Y032_0306g1971 [Ancylostoma ceylanicum]